MNRYWLSGCFALALAALAPAGGVGDYYAIASAHNQQLGAVDGRVRLVKGAARGRDWRLRLGRDTTDIRLATGDRKGWYLAYDPDVKDATKRRPAPMGRH